MIGEQRPRWSGQVGRDLAAIATPWLILSCQLRLELAKVAALWSALVAIGVVLLRLWLPGRSPLAAGAGRFSAATLAGLLPFAIASMIATRAHWTLAGAGALAAPLYLAAFAAGWWRCRRAPPQAAAEPRPVADQFWSGLDRRAGVIWLAAALLVIAGVHAMHAMAHTEQYTRYRTMWMSGVELGSMSREWLLRAALGIAASLIAATAAVWVVWRRRPAGDVLPARSQFAYALPVAAMIAVLYAMRIAYCLPGPHNPLRQGWDLDDVTYVADSVDARGGLPLGAHEPTLGSDAARQRTDASPLIAPMVAAVAWATGIEPAALHHSVLGPIALLWAASALWSLLFVALDRRRDLAWIGVAVSFGLLAAGNDFAGSSSYYMLLTPLQGKSLHLLALFPLQMGSLIVVLDPDRAARRADLAVALAIAFVAAAVHPFGAVTGAVLASVALAVGWRRGRAVRCAVAIVLLGSLALGAELALGPGTDAGGVMSDRVEGEIRESRDLVRVDGAPVMRQYPQLVLGGDLLTTLSVALIPLCAAIALRRRQLAVVTGWAVAALALCLLSPLGRLASYAVHPSILWRLRWLIPTPVLIGILAAVTTSAIAAVLPARVGAARPAIAGIATIALLALAGISTSVGVLAPGSAPGRLSRFPDSTYRVVELLGGRDADPFVWAPPNLCHELPQIMPNIQLVVSRDKIVRARSADDIQDVKLAMRQLMIGRLDAPGFRRMLDRYPIDVVIVPTFRRRETPPLGAGWRELGRTRGYIVWRRQGS